MPNSQVLIAGAIAANIFPTSGDSSASGGGNTGPVAIHPKNTVYFAEGLLAVRSQDLLLGAESDLVIIGSYSTASLSRRAVTGRASLLSVRMPVQSIGRVVRKIEVLRTLASTMLRLCWGGRPKTPPAGTQALA
jgi:hypothetical protein